MAKSRADKVQLMFNAGEYSPFLDSRVDTEKAAAAARELKNTICEVTGEARRRPGLRFVEAIPGPPEFYGTELTNYVEFPFWNRQFWRADPVQTTFEYGTDFQGVVRVWESGTVQYIGEGRFITTGLPGSETSLSEISHYITFTGAPGTIETVFTVSTANSDWQAVNWSGRPEVGEAAELSYGASPSSLGDVSISVWNYPDGLFLPPSLYGGLPGGIPAASGQTCLEWALNGNDVEADWGAIPEAFTTQHYGFSWELDSSDFSVANSTTHFNVSTLGGSQSGSFARTIPDSATIGLRFQIARATINRATNMFDVGPFFRTAYSTPAIQQGIDPEG